MALAHAAHLLAVLALARALGFAGLASSPLISTSKSSSSLSESLPSSITASSSDSSFLPAVRLAGPCAQPQT